MPPVSATNLTTPLFAASTSASHSSHATPTPVISSTSSTTPTPAVTLTAPVTERSPSPRLGPVDSRLHRVSATNLTTQLFTAFTSVSNSSLAASTPVVSAVSSTTPTSAITPTPAITPTAPVLDPNEDNQTLWQKALESIPAEDKVGVDLQGHSLLHNLIHTTKEKKQEIEAKKWVYRNKHGEVVPYADRFLTLLNKYSVVVDIAIQHDPHVVALVWAGFRFLLQVLSAPELSGRQKHANFMPKVATADMENVRMIFDSLDGLVRILFRCDIYEQLYTKRKLQTTPQLSNSLVKLYVAILNYLCSAKRQLSLSSSGMRGNGQFKQIS